MPPFPSIYPKNNMSYKIYHTSKTHFLIAPPTTYTSVLPHSYVSLDTTNSFMDMLEYMFCIII